MTQMKNKSQIKHKSEEKQQKKKFAIPPITTSIMSIKSTLLIITLRESCCLEVTKKKMNVTVQGLQTQANHGKLHSGSRGETKLKFWRTCNVAIALELVLDDAGRGDEEDETPEDLDEAVDEHGVLHAGVVNVDPALGLVGEGLQPGDDLGRGHDLGLSADIAHLGRGQGPPEGIGNLEKFRRV